MTDPQSPIDKMATAAAGVSASVQEAAHEAKPAFERLAERLSDSISDMAQHSRDTAIQTRHLLAQKNAASHIHGRTLHPGTLQIRVHCRRGGRVGGHAGELADAPARPLRSDHHAGPEHPAKRQAA